MIIISDKLYYRKIVLISLLKSKGIYNKDLFAKIIKGNKRSLNLIHANNVKHLRINEKSFFKHIIKDKYFRNKTLLIDKIDILSIEIGKVLKSRYYNNKSNVIFQEFIQYLLDLLRDPKVNFRNTHLSIDLVKWITKKYVVKRKINVINEIRKAGKYTLRKLKLVGELIDQIDYLNFLKNDITRVQKLRSYHTSNIDHIIMKHTNTIQSFVNADKDLKEIYTKLNVKNNTIQTKLLYNTLVKLKEQLRQKMHSIKYGIIEINDKIETSGDQFTTTVMPFTESGRVNISDKQFRNLNINTIYFNKNNQKLIKDFKNGKYNNKSIDGEIKIIYEGINGYYKKITYKQHPSLVNYEFISFSKNQRNKSYIIQYQYITTTKQKKQFKTILKNLEKSIINNRQYKSVNQFKEFITCSYNYPYLNKSENYKAFKEYYHNLTLNIKFRDLYPYLARTARQKNKFLNFTSFNNNIWRDYLMRTKINRSLANIIYRLDFNREITDFYDPKKQIHYTKRSQRIFLSNIIKEITDNDTLTKLFKEYLTDLIKDYDNRIYLFQMYGIDALKTQIISLQQYYNTNLKYKWNNKAKQINKVLRSLGRQLRHRKIYLDFILMQKFTVNKFLDNFKESNVLVQSLIHLNIDKYTSKSLIRKITIQRSKIECIQIACNNLKSLQVKYMDTKPIYIKEIKDEFTKYDELLGTSETTTIQYIDKESSIDVIQLFKCIIKFDKYLNLNDLYDRILKFQINDNSKLIDYLYKEKLILNQF